MPSELACKFTDLLLQVGFARHGCMVPAAQVFSGALQGSRSPRAHEGCNNMRISPCENAAADGLCQGFSCNFVAMWALE